MRIGLITTQYSPNYGALLQAYSLQEYMRSEFDADVEVIDYYPSHAQSFWDIYPKGRGFRHLARNLRLMVDRSAVAGKKRRMARNRQFVNEYLNCTRRCTNESDILALGRYDAYVCGSDQIWNLTRHNDPNWFLYFARLMDGVRKVAYAPSVADPIPESEKADVAKYLENLDAISVRESEDVAQIQPLTSKPVVDVCDPVFLRPADQWAQFGVSSGIDEPYIFCYFISPDESAVRAVSKVRALTGLKVVQANVNVRDKFHSEWNVLDAGPREFIGLIQGASYVCTNSFHASAFSIMFRNNLFIVPKKTANRRMGNLISTLGLPDLFATDDRISRLSDVTELTTDYGNCDVRQESWVSFSRRYLADALGRGAKE